MKEISYKTILLYYGGRRLMTPCPYGIKIRIGFASSTTRVGSKRCIACPYHI